MKTALAALFVLLTASAHGQGIYRCGNDFSQQPCGPNTKVVVAAPVKAPPLKELPDTPPAQEVIEKNKAACIAAVRNGMKDPDAAKMGTASRSGASIDYINGKTVNVVSYFMNANGKNSYGGYTGEKLHTCSFDPAERIIIRTAEIGPSIK